MKKDNRLIAVVLPAAISILCAAFCPRARAGGVEEVPEMGDGFAAAPAFDASASMPLGDIRTLAVDPQNIDLPAGLIQATHDQTIGNMGVERGQAAPEQAAFQPAPAALLNASEPAAPIAAASPENLGTSAARQTAPAAQPGVLPAPSQQAREVSAGMFLSDQPLQAQVNWAKDVLNKARNEWDKVIVGQDEAKTAVAMALVAHGHVFFQSAPGFGKTTLARAVGDSINATVKRVQGTADLLPSNITGGAVLKKNPNGENELVFQKGPVFTDILHFDEGNRAPPKTHSAVLEAMEERQVTVDGETRKLPMYFTVLETENQLEEQGVFPTPYATLDRYLFKVLLPKPTVTELTQIMRLNRDSSNKPHAEKVADLETMEYIRKIAIKLGFTSEMENYIARIVVAANARSELKKGHLVSPRAAIGLEIAARVHALMMGRTAVYPEDVEAVAPLVLRHRLILDYNVETDGVTPDKLVQEILAEVKIGEQPAAPNIVAGHESDAALAGVPGWKRLLRSPSGTRQK